jgi:hypothetical protein
VRASDWHWPDPYVTSSAPATVFQW